MSERLLVTSALPYANGPIHLGHLVEYIQTDVYVRYRRAVGDRVTYVCAADSHGTPIEISASKAGVAPGDWVESIRKGQHEDFRKFLVEFDVYYTTDSPENRRWSSRAFAALKSLGLIKRKTVEQLYCVPDGRFLPDRYVRGTCPFCGAPDQYGDACEKCGNTYDPRELGEPRCATCGTPPVVRTSDHAYVDLRRVEPLIRAWVLAEGHLEAGVREQVRGWLDDLQDWCITRDAPYFGFPVDDPEYPGKYLYVWLDAPLGYLASAEHYFAQLAPAPERLEPAAFEATFLASAAPTRLEHFIGKDILRFHAVFWPAVLHALGLKLPDRMPVHGHLTLNGEKMSKSRGTLVNASTFLETGIDPQLLRYFYAANLGSGVTDIDLSFDEFRHRINADLSNNIANLASRAFTLVAKAGVPLDEAAEDAVVALTREALARARAAYRALEYRDVVRAATQIGDLCNRRLQEAKPWEDLAAPTSRAVLAGAARGLSAIALILRPILPVFAAAVARAFGQPLPDVWSPDWEPFTGAPPVVAVEKPPQIARLAPEAVAKMVVVPAAAPPASAAKTVATGGAKPAAPGAAPTPGVIEHAVVAALEMRAGIVRAVERVAGADKLLRFTVDLGEAAPRTIVSGIAQAYPDPAPLCGTRVVVLANLAPRTIRGITSQGMILTAGDGPTLKVLTVDGEVAAGARVS